jgi:quinol monooxygenase YgiN
VRNTVSDLHVVGVLKANKGSEDLVENALRSLVEPARGEEGCIGPDIEATVTVIADPLRPCR